MFNNIFSESGNVVLKSYEPTFEGMIQSWVDRFPSYNLTEKLVKLAGKDQKYFP